MHINLYLEVWMTQLLNRLIPTFRHEIISDDRECPNWLSSQLVAATHWLNLSTGISNYNVFLGRSFNCLAILFR